MNRGFLRIAAAASVLALAVAAPSAANAGTPTVCAKQARAVTSAKKAVAKVQKAKATTPAARKQRAKRVKAAKAKHTRAKKTLASCKAKAKTAPAPAPVPTPVPAPVPVPTPLPVPPLLSVGVTTVGTLEGFAVTVAAPALPAGTVYRLAFRSRGTINATCSFMVIMNNVSANSSVLLQTQRPWCPGPGRVSLFQAVEASAPLPKLGAEIAAVDVVVNPS